MQSKSNKLAGFRFFGLGAPAGVMPKRTCTKYLPVYDMLLNWLREAKKDSKI